MFRAERYGMNNSHHHHKLALTRGVDGLGAYFRWGYAVAGGTKFHYTSFDETSRKRARTRALNQATAFRTAFVRKGLQPGQKTAVSQKRTGVSVVCLNKKGRGATPSKKKKGTVLSVMLMPQSRPGAPPFKKTNPLPAGAQKIGPPSASKKGGGVAPSSKKKGTAAKKPTPAAPHSRPGAPPPKKANPSAPASKKGGGVVPSSKKKGTAAKKPTPAAPHSRPGAPPPKKTIPSAPATSAGVRRAQKSALPARLKNKGNNSGAGVNRLKGTVSKKTAPSVLLLSHTRPPVVQGAPPTKKIGPPPRATSRPHPLSGRRGQEPPHPAGPPPIPQLHQPLAERRSSPAARVSSSSGRTADKIADKARRLGVITAYRRSGETIHPLRT
jgi:hypothetical protein